MILISVVILALSFTMGYVYFSKYTRIIQQLKKDVTKVQLDSDEVIELIKSNDELGELSTGLCYMNHQIQQGTKAMNQEKEKLSLAVDKLKKLEADQKSFIGNITHEFKTPLTVIKAYTDLMKLYGDDEKLLDDGLENISMASDRLYNLVEKVLKLSAIEKYEFDLTVEKLEVESLIEEVFAFISGKANKYNVHLKKNSSQAFIKGDHESLLLIFINLVDNAIKYNVDDGYVDVSSYEEAGRIFLEIKDSGIGISEDKRDKIFEPFYTIDKARSRETGGSGLGLSLVKELLLRQHGRIDLKENPSGGSIFVISLPKA